MRAYSPVKSLFPPPVFLCGLANHGVSDGCVQASPLGTVVGWRVVKGRGAQHQGSGITANPNGFSSLTLSGTQWDDKHQYSYLARRPHGWLQPRMSSHFRGEDKGADRGENAHSLSLPLPLNRGE